MLVGYSNGSATLDATITGILPAGWSLIDNTGLSMQRTIEGDYTPLEIVEACRDTYGVYFRFDNVAQTITVIIPDAAAPLGAFATRDLNLKEINYKGKSTDFVTRLYAYGADGLSFASINDGKPYVDNNTYSDKVVCAVWKDDRYSVAENLLADAIAKLAVMAKPDRSYDCDVVDLRATNPEMYGFLDFEVFSVATLIDDAKSFSINYQVVERWNYPYYPEKNKVIFSSSPAKIQSQVTQISESITNPNSVFQQQQAAAINNATNWITGTNGGYVVFQKNNQGQPYEILIMDQPIIDAATKVWRWNNGGLGYSSNGYNGPYTTAITQDGAIVADFITAGTLTANLIKAGVLASLNGLTTISMETGEAVLNGGLQCDTLAVKANASGANVLAELYAYQTPSGVWAPTFDINNPDGEARFHFAQGFLPNGNVSASTAVIGTFGKGRVLISANENNLGSSIYLYNDRTVAINISVDSSGNGSINLNGKAFVPRSVEINGQTINYWGW